MKKRKVHLSKISALATISILLILVVSGCSVHKRSNYILKADRFELKASYLVETKYTVNRSKLNLSDSAIVEGYVLSRIGGNPLKAVITLNKTNQKVTCDSSGYFRFKTHPINTELTIRQLGYDTFVSKAVGVRKNEAIRMKFYLGTSVVD